MKDFIYQAPLFAPLLETLQPRLEPQPGHEEPNPQNHRIVEAMVP